MAAFSAAVALEAAAAPIRHAAGATATGTDSAVAFQIDASHSGGQPTDTLAPPLTQQWNLDLQGPVTYPLIVNGRAFVTVNGGAGGGPRIYAIDLATGAIVWGPIDVGGEVTATVYDAGRIFTLNGTGVMEALDPTSGQILWVSQLPDQSYFQGPPTALNGMVYAQGGGLGASVYGVNEADGTLIWERSPQYMNNSPGAPVVTAAAVYVADPFQNLWAFDPISGATVWRHLHLGSGIGGSTAVLYANKLYARYTAAEGGNLVLDASTGAELGTFSADAPPAFSGGQGFFRTGSTLVARNLTTNSIDWQFSGGGLLDTAPIVANGYVYVGSSSGNVYALPAATGSPVATINVGTAVTGFAEGNSVAGLAIAGGTLLIPAGTHLVAFANGAPPPSPSPTPTPSASLAVPTGGVSQAVGTQIDAAHSGLQAADRTVPPLTRAWVRDLPAYSHASAPLVAGGRVFVDAGYAVYAFDRQTGAPVWGPFSTQATSYISYSDSRLFVADQNGIVTALDATTGGVLWSISLLATQVGPLTASKGIVYVGEYHFSWQLYALDESSGGVVWTTGLVGYGGFPAISDAAVYTVRACGGTNGFDRLSGARLWETQQTCSSGGGGTTPSLYNGRLYVRNTFGGKYSILDAVTGKTIRLFGSTTLPAFDGSLGFFLSGSTLVAEDLATGTIRWAFTGDGKLASSPIVVNGYVYVGSQSGLFYAVSALTGQQVWSDNSGVAFEDPFWIGVYGLGAGEGLIIATGGTRVVAYYGPRPPWWSTPPTPGVVPKSPPLEWWLSAPQVSPVATPVRSPSPFAVSGQLGATAAPLLQAWYRFLSGLGSFAGFVPPNIGADSLGTSLDFAERQPLEFARKGGQHGAETLVPRAAAQ